MLSEELQMNVLAGGPEHSGVPCTDTEASSLDHRSPGCAHLLVVEVYEWRVMLCCYLGLNPKPRPTGLFVVGLGFAVVLR